MSELKDFQQQQQAFCNRIRDPEKYPVPPGIETERMQVYEALLFDGVESMLKNSFPVLHSLMDVETFQQLARDFFKLHACKVPLFHEAPMALVEYLELHAEKYPTYPFLYELAHYEWMEVALSLSDAPLPAFQAGDVLKNIPVLTPYFGVWQYQYPVHDIQGNKPPILPAEEPFYVLGFRDADQKVHFLSLTPWSAHLIEQLSTNNSLTGEALLQKMVEVTALEEDRLIKHGKALLQEWVEQEIVLGVRHS